MMLVNIGTAGWTISRNAAEQFPREGSTLERYASRFPVTEINSSFHRPHRLSTWERWRDSVPSDFRFSVKLPKTITHQHKLVDYAALLAEFIEQAETLGDKLGVVLVQLPPKLALQPETADRFFSDLRSCTGAEVACEPRHPSWFDEEAGEMLQRLRVARVAADPSVCNAAGEPGGWAGLQYWRLHGSPVMYRSSYMDRIQDLASRVGAPTNTANKWCIFDNTASSAATGDALDLMRAMNSSDS